MAELNNYMNRIKEIYSTVKNKSNDIDEIEVYMSSYNFVRQNKRIINI